MPTVFQSVSTASGHKIIRNDLLEKYGRYEVGRWSGHPTLMPDRCYFCPLADIRPATGFVSIQKGKDRTRYGLCDSPRCIRESVRFLKEIEAENRKEETR